MPSALIVCHDVVGASMAGPGIRYWEMSAALARRGIGVTLAAPGPSPLPPLGENGRRPGEGGPGASFAALSYAVGEPTLVDAARRSDALVVTGPILEQFPELKALDVPIAVDLYDPFLFENLHRLGDTPAGWAEHQGGLHTLAEQARRGDFFVCANERQRDLYLGMLAAWGRVGPTTYAADPTLDRLLAVVPFGLPAAPPAPGRGVRGVEPGVADGDRVVVWNGGLWDWFDADTAIRAVARLAPELPALRLVFLGTRHPNPAIGEPESARRAKRLADELGLVGRHVFFRDWTPYQERGACLLDADLAISLHLAGVETRFASRTRLLDCIWAGLPLVTTEGDAIGDELVRRGLAVAVAPGDAAAAGEALRALLAEPDARGARRGAFQELREELTWDRAVAPLAAFLRTPRRAADAPGGSEERGDEERRPWGSPPTAGEATTRPERSPLPARTRDDAPAARVPTAASGEGTWRRRLAGLLPRL